MYVHMSFLLFKIFTSLQCFCYITNVCIGFLDNAGLIIQKIITITSHSNAAEALIGILNHKAVAAINVYRLISKYAFVFSTENNKTADDPYTVVCVCESVAHVYICLRDTGL